MAKLPGSFNYPEEIYASGEKVFVLYLGKTYLIPMSVFRKMSHFVYLTGVETIAITVEQHQQTNKQTSKRTSYHG